MNVLTSWRAVKLLIPHDRPASRTVMTSVMAGPLPVFRAKDFDANTQNPFVQTGYALASGFVAENGGQVTHQLVATLSLAAAADNVRGITEEQANALTSGFEDGSPAERQQLALGKRYPNIRAALLSYF